MQKQNKIIPMVFAVDDNYAPYLAVTIKSILINSRQENFFKFYILNTDLKKGNVEKLVATTDERSTVEFVSVADRMEALGQKLHLRDYFTKAIYYRIFIPALFPQHDKILYLDSDIVLTSDVAELYNIELGNNILGAVPEEVVPAVEVFSAYVEKFLGVDRYEYFNSGLLLINCKRYEEEKIEERFISMMNQVKFEVAPDQDYLNVLCKGKVKLIQTGWNKTPIRNNFDENKLKLVHYKLWYKPWLYGDILYQEHFWKYAEKTEFYSVIKATRESYGEEKIARDLLAFKRLLKMAHDYAYGVKGSRETKAECV